MTTAPWATINGQPEPLIGRACRQPDGSWRISEDVLGRASPTEVAYLPAPYAYPVQDDALLWAFPIGFSIGIPFFVDVHHRLHGFPAFHHFARDGGFAHGGHFGGFRGGFGHR